MKTLLFVAFFSLLYTSVFSQGVTIGSNTPPDPSATLDVQSTTGGFLLPRLSLQQRNAIANPATGLQIYNTTSQCIEAWFPSGSWKALECDCSVPPPAPGQVAGPAHVCEGDSAVLFTTPLVQGASVYQWQFGSGDSILSGQGTDSVLVWFSTVPGNRNATVVASNTCGSSSPFGFLVDVSNPDSTFTISPNPPLVNNNSTFSANASGASYAWTFQSGTPASSVSQSPQVSWSNTGSFQVNLTVTDADGCVSTNDSLVTVTNCQPTTWSFTTCGNSGRFGPSQAQCNSSYGTGVVNVVNGIQEWTVPATGNYTITAVGAGGGGYQGAPHNPGRGASMQGTFNLTGGSVIKILVGQQGSQGNPISSSTYAGGGGGGSFVVTNANQALIVAGGGNGTSWESWQTNGPDARTSNNGTGGGLSESQSGSHGRGGGGGGFFGNGGNYATNDADGGLSFLNGGAGGQAHGKPGHGGFGGGGATRWEGGGGGGYSGGSSVDTNMYNSSYPSYGAGSFNNGSNQNNQAGVNTGHGSVTITRICP